MNDLFLGPAIKCRECCALADGSIGHNAISSGIIRAVVAAKLKTSVFSWC